MADRKPLRLRRDSTLLFGEAQHPRANATEAFQRELEEASLLTEFLSLPGADETLTTLKELDVKTAVICDTGLTPGWVTREVLERLGLAGHIDAYAFSDDIGVTKPNALLFHTALDALDVAPGRAVHVGDMLRADIAGARAIGMRTVRITAVTGDGGVRPSPEAGVPIGATTATSIPDADEVVRSHAELLPALRRLGLGRSSTVTQSQ